MLCALATVGAACATPAPDTSSATASTSPLTLPETSTAPATTTTTLPASPADIAVPTSALDLAAALARVESDLRDPATDADTARTLGWEQQVLYRVLARNGDWLADVLATLPPELGEVVALNLGGNTAISALVEPPAALPDSWEIVAPPQPDVLVGYYREAEATSGIGWEYLAAINLVETRMGRIAGDSSAGAQGPMQFIPSSWDAFGDGGDVRDPQDAILAAGRYLAAAGGPEDMDAAIYAYNHSDDYVDAVKRYATVLQLDARAYLGYYHWQVTYRTVDGPWHLPEGYPIEPAVPLD